VGRWVCDGVCDGVFGKAVEVRRYCRRAIIGAAALGGAYC